MDCSLILFVALESVLILLAPPVIFSVLEDCVKVLTLMQHIKVRKNLGTLSIICDD